MKNKIINIVKKLPENIPKYIYENAKNRDINLKINEAINYNKKNFKKLEMHESHSCKPFIRN